MDVRITVELLRIFSGRPQEDVQRFVDAPAFDWLTARVRRRDAGIAASGGSLAVLPRKGWQ